MSKMTFHIDKGDGMKEVLRTEVYLNQVYLGEIEDGFFTPADDKILQLAPKALRKLADMCEGKEKIVDTTESLAVEPGDDVEVGRSSGAIFRAQERLEKELLKIFQPERLMFAVQEHDNKIILYIAGIRRKFVDKAVKEKIVDARVPKDFEVVVKYTRGVVQPAEEG